MKRSIVYILLAVMATGFTSCNDWLEVDMKTKVRSDKLFEDEQGFRDALIGVYINMTSESLFGRELTFGFFETLVGAYDISSSNLSYYDIAQGRLDDRAVRQKTDKMWEGLYNVIANVNNILDQIDDRKNVFSGDMYHIIKGEALALRALLHLQVFKIFGDGSDLSAMAVPYVTTLDVNVIPSSSGSELLKYVTDDLKSALVYLERDPIFTAGAKTNDKDAFLNDRQMRMNYYAATALYAEVSLWAGNKPQALEYAKKVIGVCDKLFPWVEPADITTPDDRQRDHTFSTEHIFCVNISDLRNLYNQWLAPESYEQNVLYKGTYYFDQWYERQGSGAYDYRYVYLKKVHLVSNWNYAGLKFSQPEGYNTDYAARIPLIRRSLVYYIAAECETDPAAAKGWLDAVRLQRGYSDTLAEYNENELRKEYVKEFWQEGHLFFFHKRKNITANPTDRYLPFTLADKYIIEKPDLEKEYGQ